MTEKFFTMWNVTTLEQWKLKLNHSYRQVGLLFAFFAQYFTTATLALVTELRLCLACQNVREKSKYEERSCGNCSWNQRGSECLFYCSPESAPDPPQTPRQWCIHTHLVHLTLPYILTGTSYHTQVSSASTILKESPQKVDLFWHYF